MYGAANIVKRLSLTSLADDDVSLVKRLMAVEWNREEGQLVLVLHVRIVANPCRVELAGKQQRCNLLIGPPLYELNWPRQLCGKVGLK